MSRRLEGSRQLNTSDLRVPLVGLLLVLLAGCARQPPALAPAPALDPIQQLRDDITNIVSGPGVQRAAWGIVVESIDSNDRLFELNPKALLVPASVLKLVSLAAAADAVGWDFRYETTVLGIGPVVDGVLDGDLVVVGSGDPSIGGRGGADWTIWIDALKGQGIRRITGRVIANDDGLEEPRPQLAWTWDDLGYPTGALFGALNFAENQMEVTINPNATAGGPPVLSMDVAAWRRPLRNRAVTGEPGSQQLLWPEQRPGEPFLTIAGSIPAGAQPARLRVSAGNPTFWFATSLRSALVGAGIDVGGEAYDIDDLAIERGRPGPTVLYTHRSTTLAELAKPMLKDSINLYGEANVASQRRGRGPSHQRCGSRRPPCKARRVEHPG
jgi:D-alanyl-D-alanine carboxypeptidase/D-alanyl-D-alanine-endopeptidase (penicillin-binding protein 4)